MNVDEEKLNAFLQKMLGDLGGAYIIPLVRIGDKLGLYRAMHAAGKITSSELAQQTGTAERYVREWLSAQAASGYVEYDAATERFWLSPEQALVFIDENSPVCMQGAFEVATANVLDYPKIMDAFKTGQGVGWHEHSQCLFKGVERFFRPGYAAHLVSEWLPALAGVVEKLDHGAKVADVGCGHGASTILLGQSFPNSTFIGFDYHEPSIALAREAAVAAGVDGNVSFQVAAAKSYPGKDYDVVAFFDALHDMGDPVGAAKHVLQSLADDGTWMIVEPFAHDALEDNINPVGRLYYAASTLICTPASLSQEVALGLGAQAGEKRLRDVVISGGFSHFRRAAETPFNLILEARA